MHRIIKKVPHKKRRKSKLKSHFNCNQNLKSTLLSMEKNMKTELKENQQPTVQFSTIHSAFVKSNEMLNQKSMSKISQNKHSKVNDNNNNERRKRPLSINIVDSFRSLLQPF
ncbi:unnamed protein product [Schistosoma turkestanicum]|nr:unnamed protein product [Schistosoma turkestanicum]